MPHLPHLHTEPLTFPFISPALHTGAFNSFNNQCQHSNLMFFVSPDFPVSGGLIINVLQELHISCRGVLSGPRETRGSATPSGAPTATGDSLTATNRSGCPSQRPFPQLLQTHRFISGSVTCQETGAFLLIGRRQPGKTKVRRCMETGGLQLNSL